MLQLDASLAAPDGSLQIFELGALKQDSYLDIPLAHLRWHPDVQNMKGVKSPSKQPRPVRSMYCPKARLPPGDSGMLQIFRPDITFMLPQKRHLDLIITEWVRTRAPVPPRDYQRLVAQRPARSDMLVTIVSLVCLYHNINSQHCVQGLSTMFCNVGRGSVSRRVSRHPTSTRQAALLPLDRNMGKCRGRHTLILFPRIIEVIVLSLKGRQDATRVPKVTSALAYIKCRDERTRQKMLPWPHRI